VFTKGLRSLLDPSDSEDTVPPALDPDALDLDDLLLDLDDRLDLDERPDSDPDLESDLEDRPADLEDLEDPGERADLDEIPDTSERALEDEEEEEVVVEEEEESLDTEEVLLLEGISDTVDKAVVDLVVSGTSGTAGITMVLQGESTELFTARGKTFSVYFCLSVVSMCSILWEFAHNNEVT